MTARITISIEIELAWGHHDLAGGIHEALSPDREVETKVLLYLLNACDKYNIPITFSVVGHLLEESCDGTHDGPHDSDWFAADAGTHLTTDPHFYAPDLISDIREAGVNHEIASHTYSHILCDDVDQQTLQWEFDRVEDAFASAGIDSPESFVAPRHRPIPVETLSEYGFQTVRQDFPEYSPPDGPVQTFLTTLFGSHPISFLTNSDGIAKTYCTPYPSLTTAALPVGQRDPHPAFQVVPVRVRQALHRRNIYQAVDQVVQRNTSLHLWTHLYNMANSEQWTVIEDVLRYIANSSAEMVPMHELR